MFFNRLDQLWNADRLCDERMSLDVKSPSCFTVCDQRCEENYRRVTQFPIGFHLRRQFAAIHFRHDDIEQDHVWLKVMRRLIGLGGIVFLQYQIRAGPFQKDFYEVRAVRIVIDDQNPSFSLGS